MAEARALPVGDRKIFVSSGKAWLSVGILMVFSLISIMDRQIIALLVGPMKHDLGLTDTQMGLLQGLAFALMYSFFGLPIGWAVDSYPRRFIIYIGITVWSLSAALCGLAHNFWQLFLVRSAVGAGEATVSPVAVSLISDLFPPHKVGSPMGVFAAGFPIGNGVALIMGGVIIGLFAGHSSIEVPILGTISAWRAVFLITGLPGVLIAFCAFLLSEPQRPARQEPIAVVPGNFFQETKRFVASRGTLIFFSFAAFSMCSLISYAIGGWTPAYLARVFFWTPQRIGASFGLILGLTGAISNIFGGMVIDRVYRSGRHDASFIVPAIGTLVATPFLVGAYFLPSPNLALVCLGVGLLTSGTTGAASYATWQLIAPPHLRGRLTASFVFVASIFGTSVGPVAVGFVTDHVFRNEALVGHSIAFVLAIVLPLIAILLWAGRSSLRNLSALDSASHQYRSAPI